jgi:hypothetical protein
MTQRNDDAGLLREALTMKVAAGKKAGEFSCWGEAYDIYKEDVHRLASLAGISTGEVMACTIDDVECENYE